MGICRSVKSIWAVCISSAHLQTRLGREDLLTIHDDYLKIVIRFLEDHWWDPEVGIVAAGIFHPPHRPVLATSRRAGKAKWLHAEQRAISKFEKEYASVDSSTLMVTTLSPCIKDMSESRVGPSCSKVLLDSGLTLVYSGVLDTSHVSDGIQEYRELGIHITITEDFYCKSVCQNLLGIFGTYGNRVNRDLIKIKKEIGGVFSASVG